MLTVLVAANVAMLIAVAVLALMLRSSRERLTRLDRAFDNASNQLEQLQTAFHQFAPQDVVEDIINRGASTRGERREVTVLFADLVGFTSMSEQTEPEIVVNILNGYFQAMTRAISEHNGHVAKFIGDGIMAMFGAPEPNPWQSMDGTRAALAMRAALGKYNEQLATDGLGPLRIGIGLHRGSMIAGVVGSKELMEYTVIGDVVNTASRIEGLTRKVDTDILVSDVVRAGLDRRFHLRAMEPLDVKGKAEKISTWAVDGCDE